MKKGYLIILAVIVLLGFFGCNKYNGLVNGDIDVKKAWSDVQKEYQSRADLFMNLVETVKGAAANERDILTAVTNARAGITEAKEGMAKATTPAELDAYLAKVQTAATTFRIQVEAYPTIKSTEAFLKLQDEIAGTERRISTARGDYNAVVATYNKKVRTFPGNIFANIFGFKVIEGFQAQAGTENAPKVKF